MQSPKLSPTQTPREGFHPKSQRRVLIAASLALFVLLVLGLGTRGLAAGISPFSRTTRSRTAPSLTALEDLLMGSAITFADRSKPWIQGLEATPASDQRQAITDLSEVLLAQDPERAARAAVLLGALLASGALPAETRDAAQGALIYRLSQRVDTGARWSVGPDVTAARALDRRHGSPALQASVRETLGELAHGAVPHPSLAVRVECAASVLKLTESELGSGEPGTTAFLLAVLRAETPAQTQSPRTWPRITTLAWVKTRSAEALADWTQTKSRFRPDGPWAHQVEEAARFESLLR